MKGKERAKILDDSTSDDAALSAPLEKASSAEASPTRLAGASRKRARSTTQTTSGDAAQSEEQHQPASTPQATATCASGQTRVACLPVQSADTGCAGPPADDDAGIAASGSTGAARAPQRSDVCPAAAHKKRRHSEAGSTLVAKGRGGRPPATGAGSEQSQGADLPTQASAPGDASVDREQNKRAGEGSGQPAAAGPAKEVAARGSDVRKVDGWTGPAADGLRPLQRPAATDRPVKRVVDPKVAAAAVAGARATWRAVCLQRRAESAAVATPSGPAGTCAGRCCACSCRSARDRGAIDSAECRADEARIGVDQGRTNEERAGAASQAGESKGPKRARKAVLYRRQHC